MNIKKLIEGFRCETCCKQRVFGSPPDDSPENLYLYRDLSGSTRCFCKKHMSFTIDGRSLRASHDMEGAVPCYGAKLISEIVKDLMEND